MVRGKKRVELGAEFAILTAALGFLLFFFLVRSFAPPAQLANSGEIMMKIDFGDGKTRTFKTLPREGTTAWDFLQQANAGYGLELEAGAGFWPVKIGEYGNGYSGKRWQFYLNNARGTSSPIAVKLSAGDWIIYKFE